MCIWSTDGPCFHIVLHAVLLLSGKSHCLKRPISMVGGIIGTEILKNRLPFSMFVFLILPLVRLPANTSPSIHCKMTLSVILLAAFFYRYICSDFVNVSYGDWAILYIQTAQHDSVFSFFSFYWNNAVFFDYLDWFNQRNVDLFMYFVSQCTDLGRCSRSAVFDIEIYTILDFSSDTATSERSLKK